MEKGFYSSSSRINASIDRDVGLWLTSKLEEPWSSEKITSQITQELLSAIKPKFSALEPNIKIGLLFSFLALRRKQISELEEPIKSIIQIGIEDEDEWVKTVSRLLYSLLAKQPTTESNNNQNNTAQIHINDTQFTEIRDTLMKTISTLDRPFQFLPLEFRNLSTNLLPNPLPQAHTENSHFKLKTKLPHPSMPVISTLGASLIAAPKEPSTPKKSFYEDQYSSPSTTPTLPPHSPPNTATITSASPPIPRAGRQGISTSSNSVPSHLSNNNASAPHAPTLTSSIPSHNTTTAPFVSSSAPRRNYLAQKKKMMVLDLSQVQALSQQQGKKKDVPPQVETPTADSAEKDKKEKKKRKKKESEETEQPSDSDKEKKKRKKKDKEDAEGEEKKAKKKGKKEKEEKAAAATAALTPTTLNPAKSPLLNLGLPMNIAVPGSLQNGQNASAMLSQALFNQPGAAVANKMQPITSSMTIPGIPSGQANVPAPVRSPTTIPPPKQAAVAPKIGAATPAPDTLFEQSNALSAEHMKVILAFLAGTRVNPYPHLGNVVQFLLHQEDKVTPDANQTPYIEQLIFEINYETGTWRKLRRKRMSQPTALDTASSSIVQ